MTVEQWARRWPRWTDAGPQTIRRVQHGIREFVAQYGSQQIEECELGQWALMYPGKVRYVRSFLGDAVRAGVAASNPCEGIRAASGRSRAYYLPSEDDVLVMAGAMGRYGLRKFTLLAAFTGLRVSEVCDLRAEDLLENGRVRVREGKGGRERTVALFCPEAVQEAPQTGVLFHRVLWNDDLRVRRVAWTGKQVAKRWDAMRRSMGMPANFRFHDLRRFHATWLLDRGASDLDVAVQLGHTDRSGAPNPELVRRVYGRPDHSAALSRLESLATSAE